MARLPAPGRPAAGGVIVREVLKGTPAMQLRATDLELAEDASVPWLELASGLRWRPDEAGINVHWLLDLLGHDGLVRTLDLDQGTVLVGRDETLALDLTLRPPVPEPVLPATLETSVDDFGAAPLLYAGDVLEIDGHGHVPSGGLALHRLPGDRRSARAQEARARAARRAAQGRGGAGRRAPPVDRARGRAAAGDLPGRAVRRPRPRPPTRAAIRPSSCPERARSSSSRRTSWSSLSVRAPATGALRRVALFDDGRFELDFGAGTRSELASLEEWQRLDTAVRALAAADRARQRARAARGRSPHAQLARAAHAATRCARAPVPGRPAGAGRGPRAQRRALRARAEPAEVARPTAAPRATGRRGRKQKKSFMLMSILMRGKGATSGTSPLWKRSGRAPRSLRSITRLCCAAA
jgi:hypothetical protein